MLFRALAWYMHGAEEYIHHEYSGPALKRAAKSGHKLITAYWMRNISIGLYIELPFQCIKEDDMNATWIVSANASRARFFSQEQSSKSLEEIEDMVNESVRLRQIETSESDKRGPHAATQSIHNTGGALPNKLYEPPQSPEKHEAELFARDIASYLLRAYQDGKFKQLTLVVSPQFLGMLRTLLDPQLESAVTLEINKDYTHSSPEELRAQIQAHMAKDH